MNLLSNDSHPWSNLKLEFEEDNIKTIKNPKNKNKNIQSMHYSKPNSEYYYDIDKPKPKKSTCKHKCTIL